jgi:uncharacterized membrane protein YphA (DoxX/SURF4 family)
LAAEVSLSRRTFNIGLAAVIGLVLLRVTIGWHFLYSGIWKLQTPTFSAAGFLSQAKGPLADKFYALAPDLDGREHLDVKKNTSDMKDYVDRFAAANHLNDAQRKAAASGLKERQLELIDFLTDPVRTPKPAKDVAAKAAELPEGTIKLELLDQNLNVLLKDDFADHLAKLDKLAERKAAPTHTMPYEQKRIWDEQTRLRGQAAAWSKSVDAIWEGLVADLHSTVKDGEIKEVPLAKTKLEQVDRVVTYTNVAIGACLILGLFTRFASLGGVLFLAQVVAAQPDWPGLYPPPHPSAGRSLLVNKEFVEMMALVALGLSPVGRWCGLDYIVHNGLARLMPRSKGNV